MSHTILVDEDTTGSTTEKVLGHWNLYPSEGYRQQAKYIRYKIY